MDLTDLWCELDDADSEHERVLLGHFQGWARYGKDLHNMIRYFLGELSSSQVSNGMADNLLRFSAYHGRGC